MDSNQYATYCPEDDKLRLYVGRVSRKEYEELRAEGWTCTPKQNCNFVAVWNPARERTALEYSAGEIEDEDQDPGSRAADRAERFAGYLGKRLGEAAEKADAYEEIDAAHGYQNAERAERAARRHDRMADRALISWDKAEYWQTRTAGVIRHALHKAAPGVRMGRIKTLEAEKRKHEAAQKIACGRWDAWTRAKNEPDEDRRAEIVRTLANTSHEYRDYMHPRPEECGNPYTKEHGGSLYTLLTLEKGAITEAEALALWFEAHTNPHGRGPGSWEAHIDLRLAYERQMLEAQGGTLEQKDIEAGGKLGGRLILKVSKSNATGRITSCAVLGPRVTGWAYKTTNIPFTEWAEYTIKTERIKPESYIPPTPETLAELAEIKAKIKAAQAEKAPPPLPFINPTRAEAERLQAVWNADNRRIYSENKTPLEITQEQYSATSKGTYARAETVLLQPGGKICSGFYRRAELAPVAKVRSNAGRVVILTDKPQKTFPPEVWDDPRPRIRAEVLARMDELNALACRPWNRSEEWTAEENELFKNARIVGLAYADSMTQFGLTAAGHEALKAHKAQPKKAEQAELFAEATA